MPNYTKLFNSIITSTIWSEDDKTRIIWITMLALADQNGEVQGSVPGLARLAGVSIEDVESALDKFLSPDLYSRTPEFGGKRICKIDGGWELLNHAKYRRMASLADQKDSNAKRQKRHRDRNATVTDSNATVTHSNAIVTVKTDIAEADTEAEANTDSKLKPKNRQQADSVEVLPFESELFKDAWYNWKQHRIEIKKKLTPTTTRSQLKSLHEMGEDRAIAAINYTIGKGWQGLFEPDVTNGANSARNSNSGARKPTLSDLMGGRELSIKKASDL